MLFYATPILYQTTLFPEKVRWILYLNPLTEIVEGYRDIFLYHQIPGFNALVYMIVVAFLVFIIGMFIFRKLEKGFAEEV